MVSLDSVGVKSNNRGNMEHGRAAAAQWVLGKPLNRADTAAAIRWLFEGRSVVNKGDDGQWLLDAQLVADKHGHVELSTPEPDDQSEMLGAYGQFGKEYFLMGDELPKDASAQTVAAWRTRNEVAFFELLESHPYFARSLYSVPTTPVPAQCFRRRSDGEHVWKWMWRIRMFVGKTSGQSPKRGIKSGKRKRYPA